MSACALRQCAIQYEHLSLDRQPAAMDCEHANRVAQRWGRRVMEKTGDGLVEPIAAAEGGRVLFMLL